MLQINAVMNGFTILSVASVFAAGRQDGAVILGQREKDKEFVVAMVSQEEIDRPEPAATWHQGHYFQQSPSDSALHSQAAEKAGVWFLKHSGLALLLDER